MTTMKAAHHEISKEKWRKIIKRYNESGLPVKQWCEENQVSTSQYYYWLKVLRQESLIQAGTLAVTGQTQFAEIKPSTEEPQLSHQGVCAVLRSNGNEIEILNGADPSTLEAILKIFRRS
ncbi:IS66 family insertion sequence element accessory protein TnpA [Clostridium formicaceticum]|uniref:Transposase n=1 Tax=Clostridium formicaceticum TaxID=1497 RepID=A0AAC9RKZ8_9CLOT|nr:hypothetical protein [Clostridium formicaceticum]AOY76778.1 hypothetical protein BJL90_13500 [Clostridium formicaceticum]ARE87235.1 hypothetical protein CLFO_16340 [Clostridium formicaceticum]